MMTRILPIAAAALVAVALSGCAGEPAGGGLAGAAATTATKAASPTPTPTYKTTTYTTAGGQAIEVRSDQPLPDAVRADVMAQYQPSADAAKAGVHGQYVQAANALNTGADDVAKRTGRQAAFFFAMGGGTDGRLIYVAYGSAAWPMISRLNRDEGLREAQASADGYGFDLYVFG